MSTVTEERVVLGLEEQLQEVYQQIGKMFYEDMEEVEMVGDSYSELFNAVKRIKNLLDEKTLANQGKKRCVECQSIVSLESRFCDKCGENLSDMVPIIVQENMPHIEKCTECGTILEEDAVFCPNCGVIQKSGCKEALDSSIDKQGHKSSRYFKTTVIVISSLVIVILFLLVKNFHTCDMCYKTYLGYEYYDSWDPDVTMCEECAKNYYGGFDYTRFRVK